MQATYSTKAIILNRQPFREFDSRIAVYSPNRGKLELVARGTKKVFSKLAGHLEPICLTGIMVVGGRRFDYIAGAVGENCFAEIKSDLNKISVAQKAVAVLCRLVRENEPDKRIFDLLLNFLILLNGKKRIIFDYDLFFYFFILKLLAALGYGPELYHCVVCRRKIGPGISKFDLSRGGVVCGGCGALNGGPGQGSLAISENCIKIFRVVVGENFNKTAAISIDNGLKKEIVKTVNFFYNYLFGDWPGAFLLKL